MGHAMYTRSSPSNKLSGRPSTRRSAAFLYEIATIYHWACTECIPLTSRQASPASGSYNLLSLNDCMITVSPPLFLRTNGRGVSYEAAM